MLASTWAAHFPVILNDTFLLRWQADRLSLHHPETFFNGFYPIGYTIILRLASVTGNPILTMIIIQLALAPFFAMLVFRLIERLTSGPALWIALPLALFAPPIIHAIPSATPDFFAAFAMAGCFLLLAKPNSNLILVGALAGFACIMRSHLIVLAIAIAFVVPIIRKDWIFLAKFVMGVLPFIIVQGLIQVWSGHGFFENDQALNIWKTIHGMDWTHPPDLSHQTALSVIMADPLSFLASVWNWAASYFFYILPVIAVVTAGIIPSISRRLSIRPELFIFAIVALLYLILTSAGGSVSAFTPVLPIIVACVVPFVDVVVIETNRKKTLTIALTLIVWAASLIGLCLYTAKERSRIEDYRRVETWLENQPSFDPHHIYSDDYDLYFPNVGYHIPRTTGGWGEVGLPDYLKENPHLRNSSANAEYGDFLQNGIQTAIFRIPPYDVIGYPHIQQDSTHFKLSFRTKEHEIYRIAGAGSK